MKKLLTTEWILLGLALTLPLADLALDRAGLSQWRFGNEVCQRVMIFAMLALGLNIVVGYTGLLHLGVAAFMAIGVYAYAILTCETYPFQLGFWSGAILAAVVSTVVGVLLGAPTLRLRGDYLAIVTLGFGEITQDVLQNLAKVTGGTNPINPLPPPSFLGYQLTSLVYEPWYYLYLAILVCLVIVVRNLENSRLGRQWMSLREDELAANCMGIDPTKTKVLAFAVAAAICGLAGALWASKLESTAEPITYNFSTSITVLCILVVGGLGSIRGVLVGSVLIMGTDILLRKVTDALSIQTSNVFLTPNNWKFLVFGLALVLMMRFKPEGIFPSTAIKEEMHPDSESPQTA